MAEPVQLRDITKRFDETVAVDDITLTVEAGETLGIVGPSGCGKTTTLRTVAGFETPTDGEILFGDEPVTNTPPEQRDVGLVFQSYALFDNMTVRGNVEFGLKMRDLPADERHERAKELLEILGIGELGDRDPTTLSGGQQQRVGLARALAIEPRILLLDEPMTGLDAKLKDRLQREIGSLLNDLSVTALYVTHDQEEAMVMCDRIAVMNEGEIEQIGTPREIYERPANEFVAEFVGTANLLQASVSDGRIDFGFVDVKAANLPVASGEVTAVVRPDDIKIGSGSVDATVSDFYYIGETVRATAELPDGQEVAVELDRTMTKLSEGDHVSLSFDPARIQVLRPAAD